MDNRNSFSWKNARLACCYEFWEHRRHQLLKAGVLLGFFLLVDTIICINISSEIMRFDPKYHFKGPLNFWFYSNLIMITLATEISASMMFGSLSRPTERITFLMMPLSMKEKLIGQILFYLAGGFILSVAMALVSALVTFGITSVIIGTNIFQYMGFISCSFTPMVWLSIVIGYILTISCFSLGAAYFRRYAFILTLIAGYALNIILSILFTLFSLIFIRSGSTVTHTGLYIIWILILVIGILGIILNFKVMAQRFYLSDIN